MATRRNVPGKASEPEPVSQEKSVVATSSDEKKKDEKAKAGVNRETVMKLLAFSAAMITLPIGSYFYSINRWYGGNGFYAAITAAVVANVILIGYILVAVEEDMGEGPEAAARFAEAEVRQYLKPRNR